MPVERVARSVDEHSSRLDLGRHVGEHELDAFEVGDRPPELAPLARVAPGDVEGALGDPQRLGRDPRTGMVQDAHRQLESLALLAQEVSRGYGQVLEEELSGGRAADAQLLLQLPHPKTGMVFLHYEGRDVAGGRVTVLVGPGEDHDRVGHASAGDERLGAVEHVGVAVAHGAGSHPTRVGAGPRFGQRVGGQLLAPGQRRQEGPLLRLCPGQGDGQAAQRLDRQDERGGHAEAGDLFDGQEQGQRAAADPSVLGREGDAQDVVLLEKLLDVPGELAAAIDLRRPGFDPLQAEIVDHLLDLPLLVAELEVHDARSSSRAITTRWIWFVPS